MDFGGFFLFILIAVGLLVGSISLAVAFFARSSRRWPLFGLWVFGLLSSVILGHYLYQVYWLDEKLFVAAAHGDTASVKALLSAGADPDSTWEDGTSALSAARSAGHKDVVIILEGALK